LLFASYAAWLPIQNKKENIISKTKETNRKEDNLECREQRGKFFKDGRGENKTLENAWRKTQSNEGKS